MGQLFNRINRVVRAELNSSKSDYEASYLNEGTALVAGGAVTGASVGKVGLLAGGTGYSLGVVPLAAVGSLTGAALYEALRSLIEPDASSAGVAVTGAVVGAVTSAAIGGVGVVVGGSAIGVGMASMAVAGSVVSLGLVGLNRLFQQGIDPEKLLDDAIEQMERDAQKAHQAIVNVIAIQKRLQQQYEQAQAEVNKWDRRVQLALQKGDQHLAKEALMRKKMHSGILSSLKVQLNQEPVSVKNLKQNLALLEAKILEAKGMRISLKERIAVAKANGQLQSIVARLGSNSAMAAFERMEEKIQQLETHSQAAEAFAGPDLGSQFVHVSFSDVDEELEAMKRQLMGATQQFQSKSPSSEPSNILLSSAPIDMELEDLKRQLDEL